MTIPREPLPKSPVGAKLDTRGMLSISTMFVSLAALTVSMLGAAKLVFDVFDDGLASNLEGIMLKLGVLAISFFFGWIVGLASTRAFGNLVYPIIIKFYTWGCLFAVGILYLKVIQKLYMQEYDGMHFWAYLVMLLGGLVVLLFLHLLIENHDLRPLAIPLLIISVLQLFVIVYQYVFAPNPNGNMLMGDLTIFAIMISISALMLMHLGVFSPLRNQLHDWFTRNESSKHNENTSK